MGRGLGSWVRGHPNTYSVYGLLFYSMIDDIGRIEIFCSTRFRILCRMTVSHCPRSCRSNASTLSTCLVSFLSCPNCTFVFEPIGSQVAGNTDFSMRFPQPRKIPAYSSVLVSVESTGGSGTSGLVYVDST